jgi:hypothetical protein
MSLNPTAVSVTSRPMCDYEVDGEACWFVSHERMLEGLDNNEFLDMGDNDNYLFGTTFDSVRAVMAENRLCLLDVRPEARCCSVHEDNDIECAFSWLGVEATPQLDRVSALCDIPVSAESRRGRPHHVRERQGESEHRAGRR